MFSCFCLVTAHICLANISWGFLRCYLLDLSAITTLGCRWQHWQALMRSRYSPYGTCLVSVWFAEHKKVKHMCLITSPTFKPLNSQVKDALPSMQFYWVSDAPPSDCPISYNVTPHWWVISLCLSVRYVWPRYVSDYTAMLHPLSSPRRCIAFVSLPVAHSTKSLVLIWCQTKFWCFTSAVTEYTLACIGRRAES